MLLEGGINSMYCLIFLLLDINFLITQPNRTFCGFLFFVFCFFFLLLRAALRAYGSSQARA